MALEIRFLADAQVDLEQAALWYESRQNDLGLEFIEEVENCLVRMQLNPSGFQLATSNIRRALVRRFPYAVYFREEGRRVIVFGIFHSSRSPRAWKARIRKKG